jgi:rhamnogalacturonyl hydrolase YesR
MLRGIDRGWLPREEYAPSVRRAWEAIKLRVGPDGSLVDVCTGTGKMKSLREYYDRPAILGRDDRGGAMGLLFCIEMLERGDKL